MASGHSFNKAKCYGEFEMGRKVFGWNESLVKADLCVCNADGAFLRTRSLIDRAKRVRACFVLLSNTAVS